MGMLLAVAVAAAVLAARDRDDGALETVKLEDGEQVVWLKGKYRGCVVYTDFGEAGRPRFAQIGMVFVGYQSGRYC